MKYPTCLLSVTKDIGGIKSLSDVFVALQLSFGSVGDAIAKMAAAASSGAGVFGTLSAGAAALSGTLVPIVAIAAAVAAGIYAISKAYVSASEANDKMRDSYSAYQEAQSNLESVNSELDTTKASMDAVSYTHLSRRLTSLASSLWRWVRTRQRTLLRLNLWQELVAQAAPCGHILCSG